jgi:hypothetical protein
MLLLAASFPLYTAGFLVEVAAEAVSEAALWSRLVIVRVATTLSLLLTIAAAQRSLGWATNVDFALAFSVGLGAGSLVPLLANSSIARSIVPNGSTRSLRWFSVTALGVLVATAASQYRNPDPSTLALAVLLVCYAAAACVAALAPLTKGPFS